MLVGPPESDRKSMIAKAVAKENFRGDVTRIDVRALEPWEDNTALRDVAMGHRE